MTGSYERKQTKREKMKNVTMYICYSTIIMGRGAWGRGGSCDTSVLLIPLWISLPETDLWEIHFHILTQSQLQHLIDIFICLIGGFAPHQEKDQHQFKDFSRRRKIIIFFMSTMSQHIHSVF